MSEEQGMSHFVSVEQWQKERVAKLEAQVKRYREALEEACRFLGGGILSHGQHVKQLDGSVKWELVRTHQGELYDKLTKLLKE